MTLCPSKVVSVESISTQHKKAWSSYTIYLFHGGGKDIRIEVNVLQNGKTFFFILVLFYLVG